MGKMLVISQDELNTWFVNGISVGVRQPKIIVGTKIKELLGKKGISEEDFIRDMGTNYSNELEKVLEDKTFPKEKLFNKIVDYFNTNAEGYSKEYFYDRNLKNVLVNDSRMVIAEYETEARTLEVKKELDNIIVENYKNGNPIILRLPKE